MKTYTAKPGEIQRDWYVVDAEGKTLGRLATQIADTLRGKRKPQYTPHVDTGDFVVVINAEKIHLTGQKLDQKMVYRHSGFPGGLKTRTMREQLDRRPTEVIRKAVKGMLPKNKLAAAQLTKLKVYAGPEHPHAAQAPRIWSSPDGRQSRSISVPASARPRSRASSCDRATARPGSTAARSRTTSRARRIALRLSARSRRPARRARTTFAFACTAAASAARPARCGTASRARSSRPTPSFARR